MIQSRSGKPLARYFPELSFPPGRYVVDGEIVIDDPEGGQDFGALQQRIHPAKSRIDMLAVETPSRYVAFDLLALEDESWLERPFSERRAGLEELCTTGIDCTPLTMDPERGRAVAAQRRGRGGQGRPRALPPRRAHRDDEDQAGADDRRGRRRLPPRQGAGHGRLADPRAVRRRRQDARGRPLLGLEGGREARARRQARRLRDRQPRPRRSQPVAERARTSSGSSFAPSWSSRSRSTTRAAGASATGRRSCAGATTRRRRTASSSRCRSEHRCRRHSGRRRACRARRHRGARRRRPTRDPARPGARGLARRPGVLVARWPVPRRHPRAAAVADPRLARACAPGLARQRRLRPPRGRVAAQVGAGVRRVRRRREAPVAVRPGRALRAHPGLARARRLPRHRARELGAALPHRVGRRPGRGRAVRAPGARGRRPGARDAEVPPPRRLDHLERRHARRRRRHRARAELGVARAAELAYAGGRVRAQRASGDRDLGRDRRQPRTRARVVAGVARQAPGRGCCREYPTT